jgi:hypothetical protein
MPVQRAPAKRGASLVHTLKQRLLVLDTDFGEVLIPVETTLLRTENEGKMPREEPKGGLATIRRKRGHFSRDNARSRQIRLRAVLARIPYWLASCKLCAIIKAG